MIKKKISIAVAKKIYTNLVRIRAFEERICRLYGKQEMRCPVHLYNGQEAIAAAVLVHLRRSDYVVSNHRNHGHFIAKGAQMKPLMAELYGKRTGCSGGKGGSMHMSCPDAGVVGTSAIVAGGIPIAVGLSLGSLMQKNGRITVVFFGDGAVDEGTFYESVNFASLKKLPIVFVCENNFYATNSPQKARQSNLDIHAIARFFKMPGVCVDGNDAAAVYGAADKAIEHVRAGLGPVLIEARTFRWKTHVGIESDIEKGFRQKEELDLWYERCPVERFRKYLLGRALVSRRWLDSVKLAAEQEVSRAVIFGRQSPFPRLEELNEDVY
jgi:TPP-dependent pyruvate/acetoin dehydrogenase alpha subunit